MNSDIKAVLVDDEPHCINNLKHYLKLNCPRIKVVGTGEDPDQAELLLSNLSVDMVFLDVHLFNRNIFEWLQQAQRNVPIVFVTAYEQYAHAAFKVSALDYLLKPLDTAEIQQCYKKIISFFDGRAKPPVGADKSKKITLRLGDSVYVAHVDDIVLLKANGFYTNVYFQHEGKLKMVVVSKPISTICIEWNEPLLMRVHRSYAVNLRRIAAIKKTGSGLFLETGGGVVPVAKKKSVEFLERYGA